MKKLSIFCVVFFPVGNRLVQVQGIIEVVPGSGGTIVAMVVVQNLTVVQNLARVVQKLVAVQYRSVRGCFPTKKRPGPPAAGLFNVVASPLPVVALWLAARVSSSCTNPCTGIP